MSLNANLILFKQLFNYVVANCISEVDSVYFRATIAPATRLRVLAVYQNMPGIRTAPRLSDQLAEAVAAHIIAAPACVVGRRRAVRATQCESVCVRERRGVCALAHTMVCVCVRAGVRVGARATSTHITTRGGVA